MDYVRSIGFESIYLSNLQGWERVTLELCCHKNTDLDWEHHTIVSNLNHPMTLKGVAALIVSSEMNKLSSDLTYELKHNGVATYGSYLTRLAKIKEKEALRNDIIAS